MCQDMLVSVPIAVIIGSVIGAIGVFLQLDVITVLTVSMVTGGYFEMLKKEGYFDKTLGGYSNRMKTDYED